MDVYWPEKDSVVYGNLTVIYVDTETYGAFVVRTFYLKFQVSIDNFEGDL